ncbi:hypothetical protein N9219_01735 [bacterium]|nr:hypothetical protein [bacterium]
MSDLSYKYSFYLVTYEDGRNDAFMVDRLHARGTYTSLFGKGVVRIDEITEKKCLEIWGKHE